MAKNNKVLKKMDITLLQKENYGEYAFYLQKKATSLFYYSLEYMAFLNALLKTENHYLIASDANKNICGILPLMSNAKPQHLVYNSLPYFGSNGGIIADSVAVTELLINYYNKIISKKNVLASTLITHPFHEVEERLIKHNYQDYRIGLFTDISYQTDPTEEIFSRISAVTRRNINRARKENFKVEINNDDLLVLKTMHEENIQALGGQTKSPDFFQLIPKFFIAEKQYNLYVAKKNNQIVAALLLFYYGKTVEYFIPAMDKNFRQSQPLSLIIFQAMIDAAKKGYTWWNWGGTWKTQEGVYRFKKKWATLENKYYYYTQLNALNLLSSTKAELLKQFPNFFVVPFEELNGAEQ